MMIGYSSIELHVQSWCCPSIPSREECWRGPQLPVCRPADLAAAVTFEFTPAAPCCIALLPHTAAFSPATTRQRQTVSAQPGQTRTLAAYCARRLGRPQEPDQRYLDGRFTAPRPHTQRHHDTVFVPRGEAAPGGRGGDRA